LLEDVNFGGDDPEAAKRAYLKGRAQLTACAAGDGCSGKDAAAASSSLAYLNEVENDQSIQVTVAFGAVSGSVVVVHGGEGRSRTVQMDPRTLSTSGAYDLASTVVHEVVETAGYTQAGVRSGAEGYPYHANGVRAEDGSLMGAHLPSRTCRSRDGDTGPQPRAIALGCW